MANQSHLEILRQSVEAWNSWRVAEPSARPSFAEADLSRANLSHADLSKANLIEADLSKANLSHADLSGANLSKASLSKASLYKADLSGADLTEANLPVAYLEDAILYEANLSHANLSKASLYKADLSGADLTEADLTEADLSEADLFKANLSEADLTRANLWGANLWAADLTEANLSDANLAHSNLVKTNLTGTTLTGCRIYGISAWSLNLKDAKQWNLNISDKNEPAVMVDNLEVAQFVYLLLNHKKLRDVLNATTERGVLILGRFGGGGLEVLEAIAAKLRESQYQPFIFDFDRPEDRNYTETVKTLVGLSRFVIVDLSGPSVPQELYATVPHFKIPFVPIVEEGRRQYSMVCDILEYPWVLNPPVRFVDAEHLVRVMPTQIIAPAEEWVKDRQDRLADLFDT